MEFGRVNFENTSQSYVAFDNINFQILIIASYLTEPETMTQYGEVSVRFLDDIAIALVRLKKPSREKFCKLWKICRSA